MSRIVVSGLRETLTALRRVETGAPRAIAGAHKVIAERIVVPEAKRRANARPRRVRTGRIAASIRAGGTQRSPVIRVGSRQVQDAKVQEFGGRAPLFGNRERWHVVRPRRKGGWFLFPAIRATRDRVMAEYLEALDDALRPFSQ